MGWYGADLHVVHPGCKYKSNQPLYLQLTSSKLINDEIKNIPYSLKKMFSTSELQGTSENPSICHIWWLFEL